MNDSAQIRRRSGAPRANDPLLRAGGPALSEASELGAPSFSGLVYGKGGVLRPRFRLGFSVGV